MKKTSLLITIALSVFTCVHAQVGIGTTTPNPSARLDITATNKGLLMPRIALTGTGDITTIPAPATSLLIYNTATAGIGKTAVTPGFYFYSGTAWSPLTTSGTTAAGGWSTTGNAGTDANSFIGTTDNQPLKFKVNNISAGGLDPLNENVAFGLHTLDSIEFAVKNIAIGFNSLHNNTVGNNNIGVGSRALHYNVDGSQNVAIGTSALVFNKSGSGNTAAGFSAAYNNVSGFSNVAIGTRALFLNQEGNHVIAIGDSALYNNMAGENLAIGSKALFANNSGVYNTAVGNQSLFNNLSGSQNTAVGRHSLFNNNVGIQNTALGYQSSFNNLYGNYNTAVGYNSLFFNESGNNNTALGHGSLQKNLASANTAIGTQSLNGNTTGTRLTAVGFNALGKSTTGDYNTAMGAFSLYNNLDGYKNTTVGDFSLMGNLNGAYNTALGHAALNTNVSGNYNTAVGYAADIYGTNYSNATAVGAFAQVACSNCVVLGSINGYNGAGVSTNVGIGTISPQKTLHVNPNGQGGIAIGNNLVSGGYTMLNMGISQEIGGYAFVQGGKSGSAFGNLALNPGGGFVGIRTTSPLTPLHIKQTSDDFPYNGGLRLERNGNSSHWDISTGYADQLEFVFNGAPKLYFSSIDGEIYTTSDLRMKKDITSVETVLQKLMKLEAKSYHYVDNNMEAPLSYGFIAQEVEKIFPDVISSSGSNGMKAVGYQKLNVMAIKAIQEQQLIIENQNKRISLLEEKIEQILNTVKK